MLCWLWLQGLSNLAWGLASLPLPPAKRLPSGWSEALLSAALGHMDNFNDQVGEDLHVLGKLLF
jgi:hypothetical protein